MNNLRLVTVFRAINLRLLLALIACAAFASREAYGYAMAVDMRPGAWSAYNEQGAWGWFFGFKEANGGIRLLTREKLVGTPANDARWVAANGAAIQCHRGASSPSALRGATTFVWHNGQFPVCRWVSPRDGEIFINYSLAAPGDIPKGVPVRLIVSGKDVEMSDMSAPAKAPAGQPAFHREVLRMSRWFGVKVRKGSVLDFSLDFPSRDLLASGVNPLLPRSGEVIVHIGLQPMDFNAFHDVYRPGDTARREREISREMEEKRNARTGEPIQRQPQETEEQLAKAAQADAARPRLLAHKTFQLLAGFPKDFSTQEGAGDWFYGSDDGSGFQLMKPEGAKWVGAEGVSITADKLTAVRGILPVIRWRCPVNGRMDMRCVFSNESVSGGSIKIHRSKERSSNLPPDAVGFGEVGGSGRVQNGVNDTAKGDLCEFRFALPKQKPMTADSASDPVPVHEKAQEKKEHPKTFETGAFIQIIQQLEQHPPLPPRGPGMVL